MKHHNFQVLRARELKLWDNVHHLCRGTKTELWCFRHHFSCVLSHKSHVKKFYPDKLVEQAGEGFFSSQRCLPCLVSEKENKIWPIFFFFLYIYEPFSQNKHCTKMLKEHCRHISSIEICFLSKLCTISRDTTLTPMISRKFRFCKFEIILYRYLPLSKREKYLCQQF